MLGYAGGRTVDLSPPGVHKASALERLCALLHIDRATTLAIGDMPNDLPMLRWAGRAIAVANAHPDVLRQAGAVTASNEEDGVAAILEQLRPVARSG